MKRDYLLIRVFALLLVMLVSVCAKGQISDFNFTIENEVQTAANVLEFDLYVADMDPAEDFKLATIQAGITVDPNIYNGGAISLSIVAGYSELTNASQRPWNILFDQARNVIEMTPPPIPDEASASVMSKTAPGTRICRIRLTNTQPFTAYSTANLTFSFTSPYPYPTKIAQFITPGVDHSTEVTCHSGNTFRHATDIVLNANPEIYEVGGTGSHCQGSNGLSVTLSNSEKGVNYQLKKDGVNLNGLVPGTGGPLSWNNNSAGIYTVEAVNAATFITSAMNGSAEIIMNPAPAAKAGPGFATCSGGGNQIGSAAVAGNSYSWSSSPAGFTSTEANPYVSPGETTVYTLTETITATGCSASNNVTVTIYPIPTVVINNPASVCAPQTINLKDPAITSGSTAGLAYSYWTDAGATTLYSTPAAASAGTYYIKGSTTVGCSDIKPVTVTVEALPDITVSTPPTCAPDLLTWSAGVTASPGLVTSTAGLVINTSGNNWIVIDIPSGTNITLTLTNSHCSKTMSVNAPDCSCPVVEPPVNGGNKVYCSGSPVPAITVSVLVGETADWYLTPTGGIAVAEGTTSYTPSYAGSYYAETRNTTTQCKSSTRTEVKISMNPLPQVRTGNNKEICLNASTTIGETAVDGETYRWTSTRAGFTSSAANPTVAPLETTTYTLVETNSATGCSNSQDVTVTVDHLPEAAAGNDRAVCLNASTTLGAPAVPGNTYSWSSEPAGFTSSEANPTVTPLETTVYTVTETNTATGCSNSHSVVVTVNPLPSAIAGADRGICPGSGTTLGSGNVSGNSYNWISEPAGFSSTLSNPSVKPNESTVYILTEKIDATGCTQTNQMKVTVNSLPAAAAGADREICLNSTTKLGAPAVEGSIYSWTQEPSGSLPTIAEPNVTPSVTTKYILTETITATGCFNKDSVVVTVNPLAGGVGPITGEESFTQGTTGIAYSVSPIEHVTDYTWEYSGTGVTINGTGPSVTLDFSATATSGSLSVKGHNNCGDGTVSTLAIGDVKTLKLTSIILEGLNAGNGTMIQAQDEFGPHWPDGVADHITVELHSATDYSTIVFSATDVPLSTDGKANVVIPGSFKVSYYITVNHRNSVETTTATPKSFSGSAINQSFGDPSEVYGGNLRQKDGKYLIYAADVNKDGVVDLGDMNLTETDVTAMLFGYYLTDVNGDGIVDMSDMNMIEINATDMVMVVLPY